ncbi:cytochrome b5 isoform X2 [Calliphora vicina]|uniref:cytochrome b5 isoform X2 n=1 Tax=Calliphora vicina TaxID=7373 RepID=UPI00325C18DF
MVEITLETVKEHNKPTDLWIIIENKVYDLTKFRSEHPGGEETLDEVAGRDGTKDFIDVGHSQEAREIMKKYYIGDLAAKDCKNKLPLSPNSVNATANHEKLNVQKQCCLIS